MVELIKANLTEADLSWAHLIAQTWSGANLRHNLTDVNLRVPVIPVKVTGRRKTGLVR